MQELLQTETKDEINLGELFLTLWTYKLFIASSCALGIILGGYYALNANKVYTSTAIFKLDNSSDSNSFNLDGNYASFASLVGFTPPLSSTPEDEVFGRVYIEQLDKKLNFEEDPYFNTYVPNSVDPLWKSIIKNLIGWQESPTDVQETIWQGILRKYSENITLTLTEQNSLRLEVTHEIPQRAAKIANEIMNTTIENSKIIKDENQNKMLTYLSSTLAQSLTELEVTQSNLKEFTLKNSALPLESFAAGSLQLDALREKLSKTTELHEAIAALSLILKNKTTDQNNYVTLRKKFPIVDQVEFRRILGQNETINSWSWPKTSSVDAVFEMLSERKIRLQSQIDETRIDAEKSRSALEIYAKLERESKIAEATYTVLIEQVKSQTMAAGYQHDSSKVFEYASAPTSPSAPNRNLFLTLGAVLGLLLGTSLSLFFAFNRGVYHSKEFLKKGVQAQLAASTRTIKPFRNKSLQNIDAMLLKYPNPVLRDMAVEIHKSNSTQIIVTSLSTKLKSNDIARALASYMQSDTIKVAVIDFSSKAKKQDVNGKKLSNGSFAVAETLGNVSVLIPNNCLAAMELLSDRDFIKNINSLSSTIDILFLCADNNDASSLSRVFQGQKTFHITLARTKHTKSSDLLHINSLIPIQGLLHD